MRWNSSGDISSIGVTAMIPALHTATSMPPNSAVTRSTMVPTWSGWVTSQRIGTTLPSPSAASSAATRCKASKFRAARATWAPACRYAWATFLPMPLDAPVTNARLPRKSNRSHTFIR